MPKHNKYWVLAVLALVASALGISLTATASDSPSTTWIMIDTRAQTLTMMGPRGPIEVFHNIAFGVRGAGIKQQRGDELTPLGTFTIGWFNPDSRYHFFIGLNYPNLSYAAQGRRQGTIDEATLRAIQRAHAAGRRPPQDTALGGHIGIHGVGIGDPFIHANFNWTNGCIALTNEQIERLAGQVKVGMKVEIR